MDSWLYLYLQNKAQDASGLHQTSHWPGWREAPYFPLKFPSFSPSKLSLSPLCNLVAGKTTQTNPSTPCLQLGMGRQTGDEGGLRQGFNEFCARSWRSGQLEGHKVQFLESAIFFFSAVFNCLSYVQPNHKREHSLCWRLESCDMFLGWAEAFLSDFHAIKISKQGNRERKRRERERKAQGHVHASGFHSLAQSSVAWTATCVHGYIYFYMALSVQQGKDGAFWKKGNTIS